MTTMVMLGTRKTLVFLFLHHFLVLLCCCQPRLPAASASASAANVAFDFPSFKTLRNLTLLGDSYLRNGVIGLTRELGVPSSSAGSVVLDTPIRFLFSSSSDDDNGDSDKDTMAVSFSTRFAFSITNVNAASFGDGLAFFLSPSNAPLGSPGGYLGLVNSSRLTENKFVAVEFDTHLDPHFRDPNENHVGLDIDSLDSIKTSDPISQGIDLKSGRLITAWIDYATHLANLKVFLSYGDDGAPVSKPLTPVFNVDVNLSHFVDRVMYAGFSASTEGTTELHLIHSWSFHTSGGGGFTTMGRPSPHNVSDATTVRMPPPPTPTGRSSSASASAGGDDQKTKKKKKRRKKKRVAHLLWLSIGGPAACIGVVALAALGYIMSVRRWKEGVKRRTEKDFKAELLTGPREFTYKELKSATRGFHPSSVVGRGAFGTVYKAFFLSSGTISAVKRSKHTHEGKTEFLAELIVIACLRHKNLVQLQGWCADQGELLLVYEFMPNGSLDKLLYHHHHPQQQQQQQQQQQAAAAPPGGNGAGGSSSNSILKWPHRYKIAVGLASVLTYLHQECEQQVIHRDIKTSNIMLDGCFNARLGDFGLARLMDHDKSPVSTLTAGTMGYLAPEYLQYGTATDKTDVFSYGVVILEVACGRRPIEKDQDSQRTVNLVDWVWGLHAEGRLIAAADPRLCGEFKEEDMRRLLLVGLSCANPDYAVRPSMRKVFQILNGEADPVHLPRMKPTLSFSSSLPLTLEDIVSDGEECCSDTPSPVFEINID